MSQMKSVPICFLGIGWITARLTQMSGSISTCEFVNSKVRSNLTQDTITCERKHSLYGSDKESQSVRIPATRIYESPKNIGN